MSLIGDVNAINRTEHVNTCSYLCEQHKIKWSKMEKFPPDPLFPFYFLPRVILLKVLFILLGLYVYSMHINT